MEETCSRGRGVGGVCLEEVVVGVDDVCPLELVFSVHSNILNRPTLVSITIFKK